MKKSLSSFLAASIILAAFAMLDRNQRSSASTIAVSGAIQKSGKLSLSQIENLIKNRTPDSVIAAEIAERGISFPVSAAALARLKRLNAGRATIETLQAILDRSAKPPKKPQPPPVASANKVTILVAEFEGPDPLKYRVTEKIIQRLRDATKEYSDISVEALGETITEQQGSKVARETGIKSKADILLWGYYGATPEAVDINVYFEALRAPKYLSLRQNVETQTSPISELNGFKLQTKLSREMTYLTLLTMGLARYESGDYDGAIKRFTTALSQSGVPDKMIDPTDIYIFRGNAYSFKGGADGIAQAITDYSKAIEIKPDYAYAYIGRGVTYGNKGEYDRAIADFDKAIKLKPDYADAYYNRGVTYGKKGEYDRAIADYDKATKIKPDDAEAYYNRGNAYSKKGEYDRAIADYGKAIKFKSDYAKAYYNRGVTYDDKGEYDRAIADYDKATKLKPDLAEAYYNRGVIYGKKGENDLAIADFDRAAKIKPDYAEAYLNRGATYDNKGKYDRAIADYDKAIKFKPDYALAYYNRGVAYGKKGENDLAIGDYDKAIKLKPDYADAYLNRGNAYSNKGENDLAIADFDKAIKLKRDDADAYYNRAFAYQKKGERDRAIADFKSVLRITNDSNLRQLAEKGLQELGVK